MFSFAEPAAVPRRADCMENVLCRQPECRSTHGSAQIAAADGFTGGGQLLLPCRLIDGTAGAAALQKVPIGRVDNGIRRHFGDVVADHQKRHIIHPFISSFAFKIKENHSIDVFFRPSAPDVFAENPGSHQSPCFQIRLEYNSV